MDNSLGVYCSHGWKIFTASTGQGYTEVYPWPCDECTFQDFEYSMHTDALLSLPEDFYNYG